MESRGFVHIYTGDGKGKSTAAFGLAVRALGHGRHVAIIQFLKKDKNYGEYKILSTLATMLQFGTGSFVDMKNPSPQEISSAKSGLDKSREIIFSGLYEIVILDEITVAMNLNLISEEDVIGLMTDKPNDVELILTGRGATKKMIETADLVTEMKEVKHYFKKGVKAREGIEF